MSIGPPEELFTVDEVAARLKVNPQTIRNWIERGELGAVRIGARRVRIPESDLEEFIERGSASGQRARTDEARQEFKDALAGAQAADTDDELIEALRTVARAAGALARAIRALAFLTPRLVSSPPTRPRSAHSSRVNARMADTAGLPLSA